MLLCPTASLRLSPPASPGAKRDVMDSSSLLLWQPHRLDAAPSLLKQGAAAVPPQGHTGALVAYHNSDDVLHLVRLLGLGDEVAPERMEVDQRAPAARNHLFHAHYAAIFGELVG